MNTNQVLPGRHRVEPIHKRVPIEVWERIFNRLYPSQLSRLSMVNKNFNNIVSSLSVWMDMFKAAHKRKGSHRMGGPLKHLRTLHNMPNFKSHMLYMCAISLYICERCFNMSSSTPSECVKPKKSPAPMPIMSIGRIEYVGEELDLNWTVNLCQLCLIHKKVDGTNYLDGRTRERILWYRTQR